MTSLGLRSVIVACEVVVRSVTCTPQHAVRTVTLTHARSLDSGDCPLGVPRHSGLDAHAAVDIVVQQNLPSTRTAEWYSSALVLILKEDKAPTRVKAHGFSVVCVV